MDPSQQFGPTSIPESSQMLTQENSRDDSGKGPRSFETNRIPFPLYQHRFHSHRRDRGICCKATSQKGQDRYMLLGRVVTKESRPFKCPCSFCVSNGWDPSENARIGNYDTKPLQP
uniref:Uncharacterized protein n=1 Tax=Cercocebus atys TaxID=9531 RepID=A0A2K5MEX2_CERAT